MIESFLPRNGTGGGSIIIENIDTEETVNLVKMILSQQDITEGETELPEGTFYCVYK